MRVCLLSAVVPGADPSDACAEYALRLAQDDGLEVVLALPERPPETQWNGVPVVAVDTLAAERFDVALALDWRATVRLFEVAAERYALFVEELEQRTLNAAEADRILATLAIGLPVDLIAGSAGVADELRELRPEARVLVAGGEAGPAALLKEILAEPPPAAALLPRRLMADADAAIALFRTDYKLAIESYKALERDEIVRASVAIRAAYRSDRLNAVRRSASPLVVRAKKRFGARE